jgi:hypothetical protein
MGAALADGAHLACAQAAGLSRSLIQGRGALTSSVRAQVEAGQVAKVAGRAGLRASDVDRDHVVERLRRAAAEGRLLTEELEHRVGAALSARTYGQLESLLQDLPGPRLLPRRRRRPARRWVLIALAVAIGLPLAIAAIALVAQLVIGAVAVWWLWVAAGWLLFGRRGRRYVPWSAWRGCTSWRGRGMRIGRHSRTYWA